MQENTRKYKNREIIQENIKENKNPGEIKQENIKENKNPGEIKQENIKENKNPGEIVLMRDSLNLVFYLCLRPLYILKYKN